MGEFTRLLDILYIYVVGNSCQLRRTPAGRLSSQITSRTESKEQYIKVRKGVRIVKKAARITSNGQITVPREVQRAMGVQSDDPTRCKTASGC